MTAPNMDLVCPRCYLRMSLVGDTWKCKCGHRRKDSRQPDRIAVALAHQRMRDE